MELVYSGKVRDLYADGDELIMVASDRVSVYDVVLPTPIPDKGRVLTQLSLWWFGQLTDVIGQRRHLRHRRPGAVGGPGHQVPQAADAAGRMHRPRLPGRPRPGVLPADRGDQRRAAAARARRGLPAARTGVHADHQGRGGPRRADDRRARWRRWSAPRWRPSWSGSRWRSTGAGPSWPRRAAWSSPTPSWSSGWRADGTLLLADEVLTPDSSRFWLASEWVPDRPQRSLDKQFLRDWSAGLDWDRRPPGPAIPPEVVAATRERYLELYRTLTGTELE